MIGFDESSRILSSLFEQGFTPDQKKIYLVDGNIGNALRRGLHRARHAGRHQGHSARGRADG